MHPQNEDEARKRVYPRRLVSSFVESLARVGLFADALPPGASSHAEAAAGAAKRSLFTPEALLVWVHLGANLVWIGSAVAMGLVMASKDGDPKLRGALARRIYTRAAMPAFVVSFVAALLRTGMDLKYYFVQHHWMHGKLLFALAAIAIHHILGARARKMEAGSMQEAGPSAMLTIVFAVSAIIAAFFVILRFPD